MAEKLVEIDEAELLRLRSLQGTVGALLKHPTARKKLAAATREINPEDPLAKELDQPDPTEKRFSALEEQNAKLLKQIEDDKTERDKNSRLDAIKTEQDRGFAALRADKWTDDGIAKVKQVMEDKGILDVAIAAKWVESQMPVQTPVTPGGHGGWGFMEAPAEGNGDIKALIASQGENESLLLKMAHDAITEVRGTPRR